MYKSIYLSGFTDMPELINQQLSKKEDGATDRPYHERLATSKIRGGVQSLRDHCRHVDTTGEARAKK
jgi:hypothetical protein